MHLSIILSALGLVPSISAHYVIYNTYGSHNPNIKGWALGYRKDTPRGSTTYQLPYQQDVAVFSTPAVPAWGKPRDRLVNGCGINIYYISRAETLYQPQNFVPANNWAKNEQYFKYKYIPKMPQPPNYQGPFIPIESEIGYLIGNNSLPQATQGGKIHFETFQINDDGAGPLQCFLNAKGDAMSWTGELGIPRQPSSGPYSTWHGANQRSWPVEVNLPAQFTCSGSYHGVNNICILKCQNFAPNGPFGGCIAFQQMDGPAKPKEPPKRVPPPTQYVPPQKPVPVPKGPKVTEELDYDYDYKLRFKRD
ncbi:hypothetical protein TWF506_001361 [Arthrobotrys conoides]|uniref:Uncharacterized protein n=1 Tax=Arthrobotrys conoides TaxID=74498 RepID=A0AAN8S539_9PEZI